MVEKSGTNADSCNNDCPPVLAGVMIPFHLHQPSRYGENDVALLYQFLVALLYHLLVEIEHGKILATSVSSF